MQSSLTTACLVSAALGLSACSMLVDTAPYVKDDLESPALPSTSVKDDAAVADATSGHDGDARVAAVDAGGDSAPDGRTFLPVPPAADGGPDDDAMVAPDPVPDASMPPPKPPVNTFVMLGQGDMSSVVISRANNPLVFFHGDLIEEKDLGLVRCADSVCATRDTVTIEYPGVGGVYPHALIDPEGRAILSYEQASWREAKFLRCKDESCSQTEQWFLEQDYHGAGVGSHSSIALGASGFPVVAYYAASTHDLRAAICFKASCCDEGKSPCPDSVDRKPRTVSVAGEGRSAGTFSSVAVGHDGFPAFAYYDATATALGFSHCADAACEKVETRLLDGAGDVDLGSHTAMTIGSDGFAMVFYHDVTNGDLKLARCNDAACSAPQVRTVDDGAAYVGIHASVAMPSDGLAIVAYHDATHADLKVAKCNDAACTSAQIHVVDGADTRVGMHTSIALRPDDELPVISYQDMDMGRIKLAFCGSSSCAP
jgi:hypothetical protein